MNIGYFLFSLTLYYALHSWLAHPSMKKRLSQLIPDRYYRMVYNLTAIILLGPIVYLYLQSTHTVLFVGNNNLQLIGGACIFGGIVLLIMTLRQYNLAEFSGLSQSKPQAEKQGSGLKTNGINRWMRHPLYTSILIALIGLFLIKPNVTFLGIAVISFVYILIGIQLEEQKLIVEFGEDYLAYKKEVSMLIPFIF